eukprot:937671-Pelagomonas_calceolata.AAC.1
MRSKWVARGGGIHKIWHKGTTAALCEPQTPAFVQIHGPPSKEGQEEAEGIVHGERAICGSGVLWTFFWLALCTGLSEQECSSRRPSLDCGLFPGGVVFGQLLPYPGCSAERLP